MQSKGIDNIIKKGRSLGKDLLVLDAGNLFFKLPTCDAASQSYWKDSASLIVQAYNQMKYDALNVGEFDLSLGVDFLLHLRDQAKFTFISSNLFDKEKNQLLIKPYLIKTYKKWKVGIFGVLSPQTAQNKSEISIQDPFVTAKAMVDKLKTQTDLIICLSNLGLSEDKKLCEMVPGIHIIIGSGSGTLLSEPLGEKSTIILQAYQKGEYIGILEVKGIASGFNPPHPNLYRSAVAKLDSTYPDDPEIKTMIATFKANHNSPTPLLPFPLPK